MSGLDAQVDRVLRRLEADGLADDTIVIFFGDNGRLEARGLDWCYDSGLHVPLIIRWPKNFPAPTPLRAGTTSDRAVAKTRASFNRGLQRITRITRIRTRAARLP